MHRIREVDGFDDDTAETLHTLHRLTFDHTAPTITPSHLEDGYWWIGYWNDEPVSFAGMIASTEYPDTGYFTRVGVVWGHRGVGLQRKHMALLERKSRSIGWTRIVSDTTADSIQSANNFISRGYKLFWPAVPWALSNSLYWTKDIS